MSPTLASFLALSLECSAVAWAGSFKGGGEHCDCLSLADLGICTTEQSCGRFDPPCIHSQIRAGDGYPNLPYPRDYGASCKAHKDPGSSCYDPITGLELPDYEQPDFCFEAWCYVDPCKCTSTRVEIKESQVLSTDGQPVVVAVSYANCGSSEQVGPEGNITAWADQYGQCPGFAPNHGRQCNVTSVSTEVALVGAEVGPDGKNERSTFIALFVAVSLGLAAAVSAVVVGRSCQRHWRTRGSEANTAAKVASPDV